MKTQDVVVYHGNSQRPENSLTGGGGLGYNDSGQEAEVIRQVEMEAT
jgi:hypothetical protein